MEQSKEFPKRTWDTCREVPIIEDEQTPWKLIKLLKTISMIVVGLAVFGLALCSKTSFLLLITLANNGTKLISSEEKPVVLLCIGCALITSSVLLFLKSIWKSCYKTSKIPRKSTLAFVLFFEFMVSAGAAILTIVAMPHLDVVTNVTILNGVGIMSALLQVISQCSAKENNRFLVPSITSVCLLLLGFVLFLVLYVTKDPGNTKMLTWIGLAVGACFLVAFNWWENYFRLISEHSRSVILKNICKDVSRCENILNILSSLLRIAVTAAVLGAYVPLSGLDWDIVNSIARRETRIIAIIIGVQIISSALCHWFSLAACKMHILRRCFVLPLYLASLSVMALLVIPVIVYYYDYRATLNGTQINFTGYCHEVIYSRNDSLNGSVFPHLVHDVTHTLCFLDMSKIFDIGILTGSAVSWWLGLVLATVHLWYMNINRIQRTQDLFVRRLYDGAFIEQSLLLNTRFNIQTRDRLRKYRDDGPVMLYLCATMWHETYEEMLNIIISIFRLDKYRPVEDEKKFRDFKFEAHIYFDDAFFDMDGHEGRALNEYARNLVQVFIEVYRIFTNIDTDFFRKQQQIPDQVLVRTPYGGRLVITMPHGNRILVHFKDKDLIRHKKRWSQIMYLYYLLGWKLMNKYFMRLSKGENESELTEEAMKEKHNTYLLALDGDTDFQPAAVVLLIDRLKIYPRVGAACGRIHPTGSGPAVWFQKFEYAVSHWLQKTAEHVFGCVLCSPGCFSLFRAEALMDDNVMKRYATKSSEASQYIQYDQGEDRWLCTLLLKQGWRVEYNAASDAYTNAPEDFKELFNQRRRWGPSTLANVVDILGASTIISKRNPSMSKPFLLYQLFNLTSAILAPATICLLIGGSLGFVFDIHASWALVLAIIPPAIYLFLCFHLKSDTQILIAAILSVFYSFLMLVVSISIIGSMVRDKTILTPSSIFVVAMAVIYLITAIMHPQEFHLVFYGFLYIICIPSAYLLLTIYSMCNMNNVSWGTRETKPPPGAAKPENDPKQTTPDKPKSKFSKFLSWFKCCKKSKEPAPQAVMKQENPLQGSDEPIPGPLNTIVEDENVNQIMELRQEDVPVEQPVHCWVTDLQNYSDDMHLQEEYLEPDEINFWNELQEQYLKPLPVDKEKQKAATNDLRDLRNKITLVFFLMNALWLVATFTLQIIEIPIKVPKFNMELEYTGEQITIEPISFMFIFGFATSVIIQFLGMFYHRLMTLIHYVAFVDTESKEPKAELEILHIPEKKVEPVSAAAWQEEDFEDDSFEDSDSMSFDEDFGEVTPV